MPARLPARLAGIAEVAPILRGACSDKDAAVAGAWRRLVLDFRASPEILDYVNGAELARYAGEGVVTPDHVIRTKNLPLICPAPEAANLPGFRIAVRSAADRFVAEYRSLFHAQ